MADVRGEVVVVGVTLPPTKLAGGVLWWRTSLPPPRDVDDALEGGRGARGARGPLEVGRLCIDRLRAFNPAPVGCVTLVLKCLCMSTVSKTDMLVEESIFPFAAGSLVVPSGCSQNKEKRIREREGEREREVSSVRGWFYLRPRFTIMTVSTMGVCSGVRCTVLS